MATRLQLLFSAPPIVGVIHLPPSLGYETFPGTAPGLKALRADLSALMQGGIDGVLLENDNDRPHTLEVSKAQVAWLTRAASEARSVCALPLGIGVQRIDWEAALAVAAAANLDFVRLDVFVDRVRMLEQEVAVDPQAVLRLRQRLKAERVQLWTDVHVKHATLIDRTSIEESARVAAASGSDAVLVTGARTGEPPDLDELRRARTAAHPKPVLIGSGLDAAGAGRLAPFADGTLVGTALLQDGRARLERVREVVAAWRAACASRP